MMYGQPLKLRWLVFFTGLFMIVMAVLKHNGYLHNYPIIEMLVFPYSGFVGVLITMVAVGIDDDPQNKRKKPRYRDGDCTPGLGDKRSGPFGDKSSWGDGGGTQGGGE